MSEAIRQLYRKRGLSPPDGKGIHTMTFHNVATRLMKKGFSRQSAYAIAMNQLGRNKSVKKGHRRND